MTNIVNLKEVSSKDWQNLVELACKSLKNNNIIAVPTDTIYGLAGLAQSTEAVKKIFEIKGRDNGKPVAICLGDVKDVHRWSLVNVSHDLLCELLPGPVTVVFERSPSLNPGLNPGTTLVGIRVPDSGFIRDVTRECKGPLALTSANISNAPSAVSIEEFNDLWPQLDVVFDGGVLGQSTVSRLGSTVVDLSKTGSFTIIRQGSAYQKTVTTLKKHGLVEERKES